ncbi:EAL domain-containing protein (plasmid) [Halopseudomonas sp. SMJS2]|uniref:EAL domain-containing protein n=1 Tax=Halopseudomonas sp. SMJS2 TaxID=3041098 RepID=UPI002452FBFC|nr:EAL domain-containing protein [Halopseudomonas sp. SMJS2]WGK63349.1 EAL domain-containing protein [Halopseudomonas sp. SMJS2]
MINSTASLAPAAEAHEQSGSPVLELALQPLMDVKVSVPKVFAYEALLRIGTPCGLELETFISACERNMSIANVDMWVATEACKILALFPDMKISINASQLSISAPEYISHVVNTAAKNKCATRLLVEVTETAHSADGAIAPGLKKLYEARIGVMIDDVFDSFAKRHLIALPFITGCKISRRTMVRLMAEEEMTGKNGHIFGEVKSLVDRCKGTGKAVVMEGIETEGELDMAKKLGIRLCQGYYFGYPKPRPGSRGSEWNLDMKQ